MLVDDVVISPPLGRLRPQPTSPSRLQLASHSKLQLAVVRWNVPLQPSNSKVVPLNLVDVVLDVGKTPNLHFLALPYLIRDHLYDINIY